MKRRRGQAGDYTVGWICALPIELAAAQEMLDEVDEDIAQNSSDDNIYTLGCIGGHNVVLACLPAGKTGTQSAATVAARMKCQFPSIRVGLMVGIGGGVPSDETDIRLGDVVISQPFLQHGGVLQYDFGKTGPDGRKIRTGWLNAPPSVLLHAVSELQALHYRGRSNLATYLSTFDRLGSFRCDMAGPDVLFEAAYNHVGGATCEQCNTEKQVKRTPRQARDVVIHYGTVASGNQVMKDGVTRDRLSEQLGRVMCFEMEAAGLMNDFPCLVIRGICDYADSHKNKKWQPYAAATAAACAKELLAVVPTMASTISGQPRRQENSPLDAERRQMLLDSLRFDQIDARYMTIKHAHAKTCKWLLKKSEYLDWLNASKLDTHHGFLWIKGKPGTGKSTLMKFALASARRTMKDKIIISFFFNARGDDLEKSTIGMYRSLLLQLLERLPELQSVFDSLHLANWTGGDCPLGIESLKSLFGEIMQSLKQYSVLCCIDALDECDEDQIRDMVSFFQNIGDLSVSAGVLFQVCFASRHYPHITIRKGLSLVLEGQEGHSQDITNYLESELKIGYTKLAKQIRVELQEKASGIFMWVVLVVGILNKEYDGGRIHVLRKRLQDIPGDLHELFRNILTRDRHNSDELVLCIQWVLFSRQLLSTIQLYFAIRSGVDPEALSKWDSEEITTHDIDRFILESSKGLAEITTSKPPKVQFIHESVRDFLLKENGLGEIWPNLGFNFPGQSHERLKQCCLEYMNMDVSILLKLSEPLPKGQSSEYLALYRSEMDAYPFLEYAVHNLLYHADMAEGSGIAQGHFMQSFQLARWIQLDNIFERHEVRRHTMNASLLYILAEKGLSNLIKGHPSILSYLERENERYGLPLFAALATGSEEVVQTFLKAHAASRPLGNLLHVLCNQYCRDGRRQTKIGRDFKFSKRRTILSYLTELGDDILLAFVLNTGELGPDVKDKDGRTPSWYAVSRDDNDVTGLLIEMDRFDVDVRYNGETLLMHAAERGAQATVKQILAKGKCDVNLTNKFGWTTLWLAAINGHNAIVELLLAMDRGGDVSTDESGWTWRFSIIEEGQHWHRAIAKMLLETGEGKAGVDPGYKTRTPLSWATEKGHEAIAQLLLEEGNFDVSARYGGKASLSWAVADGHEALVDMLLGTGRVDVDSKDADGNSPLWTAVDCGHSAIFNLLLNTGKVDVDLEGEQGWTPLARASGKGYETVVKLLLDTGKVDVDSKDKYGYTPLAWASGKGYKTVVKLLLDTGKVNFDSKDKYGQTPLSQASEHGHETVVKLLLDTGKVDVNLKDTYGQTPLSRASENGHETVVKLLLDTGKVNVDSEDKYGRTPLSLASAKGNEVVVKLLLDTGRVDVNLKDKSGRTPLLRAATFGNRAVVKLLLNTGKVNVNLKHKNGQTPLLEAVGNGHEAVARLLRSFIDSSSSCAQ